MKKAVWNLVLAFAFISWQIAYADNDASKAEQKFDANTKSKVINRLNQYLEEHYIFPNKVEKLTNKIQEKNIQESLSKSESAEEFEQNVNELLKTEINDLHLRVYYSEQPLPNTKNDVEFKALMENQERKMMRSMNYGINKIERLPFNIGYIDVSLFANENLAKDTIASAFGLVAHTDALIIDLRHCRGGDPKTVALVASYLLENPTHLSDIYTRKNNVTERIESLASVPGKHYGEKRPLYILTGKKSFSAAEDFAYTLKHLNRAKVVGEVTGGGAHPGDFFRLSDHFEVFIPSSRTINPITKSNWEAIGVQPNIKVDEQSALSQAQVAILSYFKKVEQDDARKKRMEKRIEMLKTSAD